VDTFIEIGPGEVLSGLISRVAPEVKTINVGSAAAVAEFAAGA